MQSGSVSQALMAVGTKIILAHGNNPLKVFVSNKLAAWLKQMLDIWEKEDPSTRKKLSVEMDVPEFLAGAAQHKDTTGQMKAVGDLLLIEYYYLLCVGEYTKKGFRNESKQTKQFKLDDVTCFNKDKEEKLHPLTREAPSKDILMAKRATLKSLIIRRMV